MGRPFASHSFRWRSHTLLARLGLRDLGHVNSAVLVRKNFQTIRIAYFQYFWRKR